jgi:hypothetical protein
MPCLASLTEKGNENRSHLKGSKKAPMVGAVAQISHAEAGRTYSAKTLTCPGALLAIRCGFEI